MARAGALTRLDDLIEAVGRLVYRLNNPLGAMSAVPLTNPAPFYRMGEPKRIPVGPNTAATWFDVTIPQGATTDTTGLYTWTFPSAYAAGAIPICEAIAEGANPSGGTLVNAQIEGPPTNALVRVRVNKSTQTVASLLGLTILSVPASVGATVVHIACVAP